MRDELSVIASAAIADAEDGVEISPLRRSLPIGQSGVMSGRPSNNIVGVVGGMGPESTVLYYRRLLEGHRRRNREGGDLPIVITSVDGATLLGWLHAGALAAVADALAVELQRLERAGASVALLASNSVHAAYRDLLARSPIELVSIVEATADQAVQQGVRRVLVLGTRFVTEGAFFREVLVRSNIDVIAPSAEERVFIHDRYVDELLAGRVEEPTVQRLRSIVERAREHYEIDGVVLAGTELTLLADRLAIDGVSLLDTTDIHVEAALRRVAP